MSNGSTNGHATNNIKGNSAIPPIKSYEDDRNATSQDVYVYPSSSAILPPPWIHTNVLVHTQHLTEYPFLTHTKSSELVLMDPSFYRISI